ncbi:MAG: FAD-dependent oxidoreductase [Thermoanaerobacter sp.]|nr:FAD-dependent oxidoreductase [Thermoanaerobacter sp.]
MSDLESLGSVVQTDVLVIGGGYAGLWAANRAKEIAGDVLDVLIVEKGPPMGFAGQAYFSGGGIQACPPGKDPGDHVKDAMYLGDGLYEQDLLEKIFKQSWDRVEDFQRLGVEFLKVV